MQLLHSSPVASPEFASLSLLLSAGGMTDPVMVVSVLSTISKGTALAAVEELHGHVTSILDSTKKERNSFAAELLREDEKSLRSMQIYRPSSVGHGLGMHYRVMRGPEAAKLQPLIVASGKVEPSPELLGVILCVGVAGVPLAHCAEPTAYTLEQRMSDCTGYILQRNADAAAAKSLMTTFLLSENDEYRISNERMQAPNLLVLPELSDDKGKAGGVLSPMGMISPIADFRKSTKRGGNKGNMGGDDGPDESKEMGFPISLELGSADAARVMTDRLSVLSVAESHTLLRKYEQSGQERRANLDLTGFTKSRFRRRKADARDADFDHFDYKGPAKEAVQRTAAKAIPALQPTPEPPAGKLQLKSSKKDTRKMPGGRRLGTHVGDRKRTLKHEFDDEATMDTRETRSHSGNHDASSVLSQTRIQVNVALNEDLTCSYKLSQLSSCSVEGVVQVSIVATLHWISLHCVAS